MVQSLKGRCFLNVRPHGQAAPLTLLLQQLGAEVVEFPALEVAHRSEVSELRDLLVVQSWLIITSPNGAEALFRAFVRGEFVPESVKIAALAPGTAEVLKRLGFNPSFIGVEGNSEAFAEEFIAANPPPAPVVLFRGERSSRSLPLRLSEAGYTVSEVLAYRTHLPTLGPSSEEFLRSFDPQKYSGVFVGSAATVENLHTLLVSGRSSESRTQHLPLFCVGEKTASRAAELGFTNVMTAVKPTNEALLNLAENYYQNLSTNAV